MYWTTLDNEGGLWWEPAWESLQARLGDRAVGFRAEGPLPEVLSLQPGATVRGVVRSAAGSIPGGLWLHLNSKESAIKTQIADDGSFELRGLPAGKHPGTARFRDRADLDPDCGALRWHRNRLGLGPVDPERSIPTESGL
ncbi:MAG: hypothetical protein R3E96_15625 [Planctomycetota bacterium]